jgi:AcrR family transcriptional regulator
MAPKLRTVPRKRPVQDRSRATVDAILAAAAQVLVKDGYDRATTNRVAEVAGVSIGSVYQYFPSKEALVAALVERHNEAMRAAVLAELARVEALPIEAAVRAVIELIVRAHAVEPELHRVLMEQVPRTGRLARVAEFETALHAVVVRFLDRHRARLRVADLDLAAFLAAAAVEAMAHGAVIYQPHRLEDPAFLDEATALVVRYLLR